MQLRNVAASFERVAHPCYREVWNLTRPSPEGQD